MLSRHLSGLLLLGSSAVHAAGTIQKTGLALPSDAATNRNAVQTVFLTGYNAYIKYASGHDDLEPISKSYTDPRNGWGSTLFDAMDTLFIMNQTTLFNQAVSVAAAVDFSTSKTSDDVSFFETTIRYLGGMLSAYELSGKKNAALLANAKKLGDKLLYAWPAGYKTPVGSVDFSTNTPDIGGGGPNGLAAAASNILEFQKLTQFTGNQTYLRFANLTMYTIATEANPVFPGLPPQNVNSDGTGSGATVTWDGGYDSYLEYLIKYARLINFSNPLWATSWTNAVESSITHLLKQSTGGQWFLNAYNSGTLSYSTGDLACFAGGNWIMGGKLLNRPDIVQWGLNLTDACMTTYSTPTGLGPGAWAFTATDGGGGSPPAAQAAFAKQHGFWITDSSYYVRPEVFESVFYAWRATGNVKYYNFAASGIKAIAKYMKSNVGYAPLVNVTDATTSTSNQNDDLESFFFAEVLKYLYLTFDDPSHISLDTYVFNTEAHPFLPVQ